MKEYLQLTRSQSISATILICLIGMLIGGGSWRSPMTPLLAAWSILFHWSGMITNEIMDLTHDFKSKKHFKPLMSGKIKTSSTTTVLLIIQTAAFAIGVFISHGINFALFWMFFASFSSIIYNVLSKTTLKILLLGNIWVGTALFGYFTQATTFNLLILLFIFNIWFMFAVDAAYSGQYKDPGDQKNILRFLGAIHNSKEFVPSSKTSFLIWTATTVKIILALFMWHISNGYEQIINVVPLILSITFLVSETRKISRIEKNFDRPYATKRSVLYEIATASLLASSIVSVLGGVFVLFLVISISISSLIILNRCTWGRWRITPDV